MKMNKTCDDCAYCTYDSLSDCYICDLTEDRIELHDEACEEFVPG